MLYYIISALKSFVLIIIASLMIVLIVLFGISSIKSRCCKVDNYPASFGCKGKLFIRKIPIDGVKRRYAIYVPRDIRCRACPIIFELHGGGVYIEDMIGTSGYKSPYKLWMKLADIEKFIVVYPEGLNGKYGKPTWNDCRANININSKADDVAFISALIDYISSRYKIDLRCIYVSGMSNGGLMALRLASELSDKIAAVATVGASMPDNSKCSCPERPISVLFMNGTADKYLPYNGGTLSNPPKPSHGTVYPVEDSVRLWIAVNHTDKSPVVYKFPDLDTNDGGTVTKYTYSNGIKGTEVILYKIEGGGHAAPSIEERYSALFEYYFGKQNHDIEMVREAWKFFKDKMLH